MTKTYLVPPAAPHNEGKTVAAWVLSALVVLGAVVVAFGMGTANPAILWSGVAVIALGLIVGFVLRTMGLGQKAKKNS